MPAWYLPPDPFSPRPPSGRGLLQWYFLQQHAFSPAPRRSPLPSDETIAGTPANLIRPDQQSPRPAVLQILKLSVAEVEAHRLQAQTLQLSCISPTLAPAGTMISFMAGLTARMRLDVYDLHGRPVALLADRHISPGAHQLIWNGCNARDRPLASGSYFIRLTSAAGTETASLLLLR